MQANRGHIIAVGGQRGDGTEARSQKPKVGVQRPEEEKKPATRGQRAGDVGKRPGWRLHSEDRDEKQEATGRRWRLFVLKCYERTNVLCDGSVSYDFPKKAPPSTPERP
jgi:hypothetical protein